MFRELIEGLSNFFPLFVKCLSVFKLHASRNFSFHKSKPHSLRNTYFTSVITTLRLSLTLTSKILNLKSPHLQFSLKSTPYSLPLPSPSPTSTPLRINPPNHLPLHIQRNHLPITILPMNTHSTAIVIWTLNHQHHSLLCIK